MATWTSSYELSPAQSDPPSYLGTTGRDVRVAVRERWENEHTSYTTKGGSSGGAIANDFVHKKGSARAYYQSSSPSLRPDGSTTLGSSDDGRLWVDTSVGFTLKVWTGSAWQSVTSPASPFRVYGDGSNYTEVYNSVTHGGVYAAGPKPLLLNQFGSWVAVGYNSTTSPGVTFYVNGSMRSSSLTVDSSISAGSLSVSGAISASSVTTGYLSASAKTISKYDSTSYIDWTDFSFSYAIVSGTGTKYFLIYRPATVVITVSGSSEGSLVIQCYNGSTFIDGQSFLSYNSTRSYMIPLNPGYYRYVTANLSSAAIYSIGVFGGNTSNAAY